MTYVLQDIWPRDGNLQDYAGLHHLPDTVSSGDIPSDTPNFSLGAAIGGGHDGIADDVDLIGLFDDVESCYTQHTGCLHLNVKAATQGPRQQLALLRRMVDMLNKTGRLFCITVTLWGQQLTIHKDTEKQAPVATWGKLQLPHITSAYFSSVDASQFVLEGDYLEGARVWAFCVGQKPMEYLKLAPNAADAGSGGSGASQKAACSLVDLSTLTANALLHSLDPAFILKAFLGLSMLVADRCPHGWLNCV